MTINRPRVMVLGASAALTIALAQRLHDFAEVILVNDEEKVHEEIHLHAPDQDRLDLPDSDPVIVGAGSVLSRLAKLAVAFAPTPVVHAIAPSSYWDGYWEVDPAVLSRPIEDTMPTQAGVWSTPGYRRTTSIAHGAGHKESDLGR